MVRLLNFLFYQTGWFACVLGAAFSRPWLGTAVALALVTIHLWLATDRQDQIVTMVLATGVGLLVDSVLLGIGVLTFPAGVVVAWLPPLWMSVLWMQFSTTFRYSLKWLSGRYALSAILGLFGAPLAFVGGERLGAVSFCPPLTLHLIILATLWGIAIPLLIYASDRIYSTSNLTASYRGFESIKVH